MGFCISCFLTGCRSKKMFNQAALTQPRIKKPENTTQLVFPQTHTHAHQCSWYAFRCLPLWTSTMFFHPYRSSTGISANIFEWIWSETVWRMLIHCSSRGEFSLATAKDLSYCRQLVKASLLAESCEGCRELRSFPYCQFHQWIACIKTPSAPLSYVFDHRKPWGPRNMSASCWKSRG